jgi:hypothetical protein
LRVVTRGVASTPPELSSCALLRCSVKPPVASILGNSAARCTRYCERAMVTLASAICRSWLLAIAWLMIACRCVSLKTSR